MGKNKSQDPRLLAIFVIEQVIKGRELQAALDDILRSRFLKLQDKALLTHLTYGYFRLKTRLEFVLRFKIRGRFKKLPKRFVLCLALATYEILYLDKIPEYATVCWYVEYIKKKVNNSLTALANGVLRNISREKALLISEDFYREHTKNQNDFLTAYYSMPEFLINMLYSQYDREEAAVFLEKSLLKPYIGIRINKNLEEGKSLKENILAKKRYELVVGERIFGFEKIDFSLDDLEKKGIISRKSVESQKILLDLRCDKWETPIWDVCAGFGGKTTFLIEEGIFPVWASDVNLKRLIGLKQEKKRLFLPEFPIFLADGCSVYPLKRRPSTILLDVPCSGLGVLCRRPDVKWKMTKEYIEKLKLIQYKMLDIASEFLDKGGKIVYITCTWNREENEEQLFRLIKKKKGFVLDKEVGVNFYSVYREFFYGAVLKKV